MSNTIKIYLAGKMSGLTLKQMQEWRVNIKSELLRLVDLKNKNINVINPVEYYNFENPRHKTEKEVMQFDLNLVRNSDIVIVNLCGLNTSIGTCIELYEAYKLNIPVLALGGLCTYANLHPWIKECITRVDYKQDDLIEYINDFYFT